MKLYIIIAAIATSTTITASGPPPFTNRPVLPPLGSLVQTRPRRLLNPVTPHHHHHQQQQPHHVQQQQQPQHLPGYHMEITSRNNRLQRQAEEAEAKIRDPQRRKEIEAAEAEARPKHAEAAEAWHLTEIANSAACERLQRQVEADKNRGYTFWGHWQKQLRTCQQAQHHAAWRGEDHRQEIGSWTIPEIERSISYARRCQIRADQILNKGKSKGPPLS